MFSALIVKIRTLIKDLLDSEWTLTSVKAMLLSVELSIVNAVKFLHPQLRYKI